jgi:NADPH:quinone reductase-like Zn-dependent oxidoreductase
MNKRLAATLLCTYGTAWRGMTRFGAPGPNDVLVVVGAHGGVGLAALELGKRLGCEVVAVVRRDAPELLRRAGADHIIINDDGRFHKKLPTAPARVVLDCVGAATFNASLRCLGVGGRLVVIGNIDPMRAELQLGKLILTGLSVVGSSGAGDAEIAELLALHAASPLSPHFASDYPLADAEQAMRALQAGGVGGRHILIP